MERVRVEEMLSCIAQQVRPLMSEGLLPEFIPQLATVDKLQFGIAFASVDGWEAFAGDANMQFSIQSISKLFALQLALETMGSALWNRISKEPSGRPFNDLIQIEEDAGAVRNPFINAGALVVTDALCTMHATPELEMLNMLRFRSGGLNVRIDEKVMSSERETCHRNAAMAHLLKSYGRIENRVDRVLDSYCAQCAISMDCLQLARSVAPLARTESSFASDGVSAGLSSEQRHAVVALMMTCGMYDAAGEFAARIGLPMKSGSGGGIVAVIPGVGSVCAWSPGLDRNANSIAGARAIELFAKYAGISIFSQGYRGAAGARAFGTAVSS